MIEIATSNSPEKQSEERTPELAKLLSLLRATLESTTDGILALDLTGKVMSYNSKFASIWQFPTGLLERRDPVEMVNHSARQVKNSEHFLDRFKDLQSHPEAETCETIELKDGRVFERCVRPQRIDNQCVGVVINWRDITGREKAENALRESQALYHSLVDQLPVGVFRKDKEGRYVFVNSAFCQFKAMTAEQIVGKKPLEIAAQPSAHSHNSWPTGLAAEGTKHHEVILQTGRQIEVDEEYPGADGKPKYWHVVKSPVFGSDGAIIGTQGIMFDITERKRAETAFANERHLLRALMDYSPDCIYFKDRDSRFIRSSTAMAPLFKVSSPDEMVGKRDFDFFDRDHAQSAFEDEQKIIRTGQALIGKTEKETFPDGRVSWALTSKMPLHDDHGNIIGTFGISKDITTFKETEAKLDEAHKQLLETSRHAGMAEVATGILHNVGNVLNSVNVATSMLSDRLTKSKTAYVSRVADLMRENADHLGEFIMNDPKGKRLPAFIAELADHLAKEQATALEELSGLQKNIEHIKDIVAMQQTYAKVSGVTERIKVAELVDDALRMNESALLRHDVQLVREYEGDLREITVDRHKVLQILINLIRNAKYACDDTTAKDKRMTVRISEADGRIGISVIDNGVGIPQENLTRIFNHGFTTRKNGHGFGLHSGALAAKEMGGALLVHSDGPGKGASFTLQLPLHPPVS